MKKYLILLTALFCHYAYSDLGSAVSIVNNALKNSDNSNVNDNSKYYFYFNGETLSSALKMYARSSGQGIDISPEVSRSTLAKTVIGKFDAQSDEQILNIFAKRYGINWFSYSGTIYITPQTIVSKNISVDPASITTLKDTLKTQGLLSDRFGFSILPKLNQVIISGPKRYVDMLSSQITGLSIAPAAEQFAVYRLKYASADDLNLTFGTQQITIPGVATILKNLLSNNTNNKSQGMLSSQISEQIRGQLDSLSGKLGNSAGNSNAITNDQDKKSSSASIGSDGGVITTPLIQSDSRLNTIIIRDKASNLNIYRQLIQLLDVSSPLIQVEILSVNLDQKKLEEDGVNWWGSFSQVGLGYGANKLTAPPGNNLSFYYGQINPGQTLVNSINNFMLGLDYLEQHNYAQTVDRPSLVTTDNIPAILSSVQTIYLDTPNTSLTGNGNVIYTPIPAQVTTALSITPHVIYQNNRREVKLSISLQDGSIRELNNAQYPDTLQNSLNSQAVITEGQSLLIAGYSKTTRDKVVNQVPILGDIPLLGWFFKHSTTTDHKVITVYLVTPRIVWSGNINDLKNYVMVDGNKINIGTPLQVESK